MHESRLWLPSFDSDGLRLAFSVLDTSYDHNKEEQPEVNMPAMNEEVKTMMKELKINWIASRYGNITNSLTIYSKEAASWLKTYIR